MIDLLSTMQVLLKDAGFSTRLTEIDRLPVVCFEDDALMGFGCIFENPQALLDRWRTTEVSLQTRYASRFRVAGDKAWNVYSVFLSGAASVETQDREIGWVEENLEHTRKLAACGLNSREDLIRALLPILPLQYQPILDIEDATGRLQRTIQTIAPKAAEVVLNPQIGAAEVVRLLGEPV